MIKVREVLDDIGYMFGIGEVIVFLEIVLYVVWFFWIIILLFVVYEMMVFVELDVLMNLFLMLFFLLFWKVKEIVILKGWCLFLVFINIKFIKKL